MQAESKKLKTKLEIEFRSAANGREATRRPKVSFIRNQFQKKVVLPNRFKHSFRNKRALAPIFASLIILAVVTILFVPVFIWTTTNASAAQDDWQLSSQTITERIVVEEVELKYGYSDCTIYVRNIGKTSVSINNVLITGPNAQVYVYEKSINAIPNSLTTDKSFVVQGELLTITIPNLNMLTIAQNKQYTVRVVTEKGAGGEFQIET